ncbi:MAG: glycosyltransferase [Rhodobacteraceae bacterium]|nr:glycosyltransferase [Paracoccaceae bacterium]
MTNPVDIAIIIPVWHHPALVSEVIASCLAQENAPRFQIIVVNDGCDFPETISVLTGWHASHPDKITVLTQQNQGLSAARNTGINFALKNHADLRGIYFLDADNLLEPDALALFARLLSSPDPAGWFYPQFDMFGLASNRNTGGKFSLSRLAFSNYCDAGSLVRRAVFDSGLRFDETLKSGFEDWDFWLGAAALGFDGTPVTQTFLGYRKRPDSMLSSAHQEADRLFNMLKQKHKWLFSGYNLNNNWLQEWPRFTLISTDIDAKNLSRITHDFFNWRARPFESDFPPVLIFYAPEVFAKLDDLKMLDSVLYQLEGALRDTPIAGVQVRTKSGNIGFEHLQTRPDGTGTMLEDCGIIALSRHHLDESLKMDGMIEMITYMIGDVLVSKYELTVPDDISVPESALGALVNLASELSESPLIQMGKSELRNWRQPAEIIWPNAIAHEISQENAGRPRIAPKTEGRQVGFVLPIFRFGGVEKCVVALARELTQQGITCHLFIAGIDGAAATGWMYEPFETVSILSDTRLLDWRGDIYLGTTGAAKPDDRLLGDLIGPLTALDVVVNCGTGMLHHGVSALRKRGIKTITWEHLTEETPYGRTVGTPFIALAHEAGYDHIATCSNALADRLAGHGVPRGKLLPLPNGPGFPAQISPDRALTTGPLRVGFLGRFDAQKGFDRFIEIAINLRGKNFYFSVRGGSILEEAVATAPDWMQSGPPILEPAEIAAFLRELDVLVMPSRNEGLPLTILEAQRAGVVVLASDVGAVSEAISDTKTGILLPADTVIDSAIRWLISLENDRPKLLKMAQNAAGRPDNWAKNACAFVKAVFE